MGAVYLAEDVMLGRQVALKILPQRFAKNRALMSSSVRWASTSNPQSARTATNSSGVKLLCQGSPRRDTSARTVSNTASCSADVGTPEHG